MNKEIKEIINDIKYFATSEYPDILELYDNECKILLDYITNLQQENERLKEENNNKAMNDYAHAIDESWYRELYDDYKSRCEKAIEYCKSYSCWEDEDGTFHETDFCIEDLLNILQNGSDDNVN